MKLMFKERLFSWLDSYDVFNQEGDTVFSVEGKLSWGHCLQIHDESGHIATVKEVLLTFLPRFELIKNDETMGFIQKEFTFLRPKYNIDFNEWHIEGDFMEWDYQIFDYNQELIATINKEIFNWTDTYCLDICNDADALDVLMLVLAIDAEKCSRN